MGNQNEGFIFVSPLVTNLLNLTDYVAALFPTLDARPIAAIVSEYTGIGLDTVFDQAVAIYGDGKTEPLHLSSSTFFLPKMSAAILICPTYTLMNSVEGSVHKVQ